MDCLKTDDFELFRAIVDPLDPLDREEVLQMYKKAENGSFLPVFAMELLNVDIGTALSGSLVRHGASLDSRCGWYVDLRGINMAIKNGLDGPSLINMADA